MAPMQQDKHSGNSTKKPDLKFTVHFLAWAENENFDGRNGEGGTDAGGTGAGETDAGGKEVAAKDAGTSAVGFGNTSAVLVLTGI